MIHQTRYGSMLLPEVDQVVSDSLRMYGEWGQCELDFILPYIHDTDIVLDIGANIGSHTLPMALRAKTVYAFEPSKATYYFLCGNLALNSLDNVVAVNGAVGASDCQVGFTYYDTKTPGNWGCAHVSEGSDYLVPMLRLDSLNLPKVDVIKMDIEGYEYQALLGAVETIERCKPKLLYMEAHCDHDEIKSLLEPLGYSFQTHSAHSYNANNYNGNPDSGIHGSFAEQNLVATL